MIDSTHSPDRHYLDIQKAKYQSEITEGPKNPAIFNILKGKIISLVNKYHPETSLLVDVGGFNGQMTDTLNALVVDISESILAQAACKNIPVICADMHHLPFRRDSLKSVLLCHVLEHSPMPLDLLKSIHDILTNNGHLFLVLPNAASSGQIFKLLLHGQVKPSGNHPLSPVIHFHQYTAKSIQPLLHSAGFRIIALTGDHVYIPFAQKLGFLKVMRHFGSMFPALSESILLVAQKRSLLKLSNEDIKKIKKTEMAIRDSEPSTEEYTLHKKTTWFNEIELRNATRLLPVENGDYVLDAGCGAGRLVKYLKQNVKQNFHAAGIDFSISSLRKIITDSHSALLICADITELPFPSETFDKAFSLQVIQHCPRPERKSFLQALHRVLKRNGRALLTSYNYTFWAPRHLNSKKEGFFKNGLYYYNFETEELREEFEECGFRVIFVSGSNIFPATHLKKLQSIGVAIDCFLTKYLPSFCLKRAQYVLIIVEKVNNESS